MTEDHTLVAQLVKTGEIQANDAASIPATYLTRALGTDKSLFDIKQLALQRRTGSYFVLTGSMAMWMNRKYCQLPPGIMTGKKL